MLLAALAILVGVAAIVWLGWSTVIAFLGGHIPLTGFHVSGPNSLRGLAWLFVGDPVGLGVIAAAVSVVFVSRAAQRSAAQAVEQPAFGVPVPQGAMPASARARVPSLGVLKTALASGMTEGILIGVVAAFTIILGLTAIGWLVWATGVAFAGGRLPLTPWHFDGFGVVRGLVWLVFADPVALYLVLIGYSLVVGAAAARPMRASIDSAAARGTDVRTARTYLRFLTLLSLAVALGAGVVWSLAK